VDGKTFKTSLGVSIGNFRDAAASVQLKYLTGSDASDVATSLNIYDSDPLVVAVSFRVKDGTDPFSLGELSGTIKNIIGLAMQKLKYELKTKMNSDYDGTQLYTLIFSFNDKDIHDNIVKALDFYQVSKLLLSLELSEGPSNVSQDVFLQLRLKFEVEVARHISRVVEAFSGQGKGEKDRRILGLFRAARGVGVEFEFDDVKEFYQAAFKGEEMPPFLENLNWNSVKTGCSPLMVKLMDPKIPEPLRDAYKKLEYLTGLHSIKAIIGRKHAITLNSKDMPLFTLLPTLDELSALVPKDD